ncbi:hypothetical protein, partial [Haloquadratum walsbyi]|uniref:hypothetical protein n=1 Tax=Haloquadratum walsbyi TaxID=293091 RepID=UPI0026EF9134
MQCQTAGKSKTVTPSLSKFAGLPEANLTLEAHIRRKIREEYRGRGWAGLGTPIASSPVPLPTRHSPRTLHAHAHGFSP